MKKHTNLSDAPCPIARSLHRVGEWWSILILRDAMIGLTRFDEFEKNLGIAPNMLTRRLADLVDAGMLEKVQYSEKPPRYEYHLTELGWSFRTVMQAFGEWGNRHFFPHGTTVQWVERASGRPARIGVVDLNTGHPITSDKYTIAPGPAADDDLKQRFAYAAAKRAGQPGVLPRRKPAGAKRDERSAELPRRPRRGKTGEPKT